VEAILPVFSLDIHGRGHFFLDFFSRAAPPRKTQVGLDPEAGKRFGLSPPLWRQPQAACLILKIWSAKKKKKTREFLIYIGKKSP
jgi:hypothetical protein